MTVCLFVKNILVSGSIVITLNCVCVCVCVRVCALLCKNIFFNMCDLEDLSCFSLGVYAFVCCVVFFLSIDFKNDEAHSVWSQCLTCIGPC